MYDSITNSRIWHTVNCVVFDNPGVSTRWEDATSTSATADFSCMGCLGAKGREEDEEIDDAMLVIMPIGC